MSIFPLLIGVLFNPQISQIARITLIIMKDDAKSIGFNSPQIAALEKIKYSF